MKNIFIIGTLIFLLQGCLLVESYFFTDFNPNHERKKLARIADGTRNFEPNDPEPPWPKNIDETIEGIDIDNDGLRDDVEIYINENFKNYNLRVAAKEYAKARIKIFLLFASGKSIDELLQEYSDRTGCLMFLLLRPNLFSENPDKDMLGGDLLFQTLFKINLMIQTPFERRKYIDKLSETINIRASELHLAYGTKDPLAECNFEVRKENREKGSF